MRRPILTRTTRWNLFASVIDELVEVRPNTFCLYDAQKKNIRYTIVYYPDIQMCGVYQFENLEIAVLPPSPSSYTFTKKLKNAFNLI